jgi:hypothetical protein
MEQQQQKKANPWAGQGAAHGPQQPEGLLQPHGPLQQLPGLGQQQQQLQQQEPSPGPEQGTAYSPDPPSFSQAFNDALGDLGLRPPRHPAAPTWPTTFEDWLRSNHPEALLHIARNLHDNYLHMPYPKDRMDSMLWAFWAQHREVLIQRPRATEDTEAVWLLDFYDPEGE